MAKSIFSIAALLLLCKSTQGYRLSNHLQRDTKSQEKEDERAAMQVGSCLSKDGEESVLPPQDPEKMNIFGAEYIVPEGSPALLHINAHDLSWSGQSGDVLDYNDEDKKLKFNIKGKASSAFHDKRVITDGNGKKVYNIKEHVLQLNMNKQTIYSAKEDGSSGEQLYQVYGNWNDTIVKTDGMKNKKGQEVSFRMDIGFFGMKGVIRLGLGKEDPIIARVCSPAQLKNFVLDNRDDYFLEVAPGVDMAAVLSVVFSYDQMNKAWTED